MLLNCPIKSCKFKGIKRCGGSLDYCTKTMPRNFSYRKTSFKFVCYFNSPFLMIKRNTAKGLSPLGAMVGFRCASLPTSILCFIILLIQLHCFFIQNTFKKFSFWSRFIGVEPLLPLKRDRALRYTNYSNFCHLMSWLYKP